MQMGYIYVLGIITEWETDWLREILASRTAFDCDFVLRIVNKSRVIGGPFHTTIPSIIFLHLIMPKLVPFLLRPH